MSLFSVNNLAILGYLNSVYLVYLAICESLFVNSLYVLEIVGNFKLKTEE